MCIKCFTSFKYSLFLQKNAIVDGNPSIEPCSEIALVRDVFRGSLAAQFHKAIGTFNDTRSLR